MTGVFKAAGDETGDRYCVSEWTVEPGGDGPGPHHHDDNEAHDFANRTGEPATAFNVFIPGGGFEQALRGWLGR